MILIVTNIVDTFFPVEGVDLSAGQSIEVAAADYGSLPGYLRLYKMQGIVTIEAKPEAASFAAHESKLAAVDTEIDS
ncbi:MAG: hypothetical protein WBP42_02620 [Candidatus Zixiibacteriota bacterium]